MLIHTGLAKVRAHTADGEAAVMAVLGPGDLMWGMVGLTAGVRNADVVALTPLKVLKLRAGAYRELLLNDGSISLALARLLAGRLTAINRRFLLRGGDATTRLLGVLLDLAHTCSSGKDPLALIPPLPQRELAAIAGGCGSPICSFCASAGCWLEVAPGGGRVVENRGPLRRQIRPG